MNTRNYICWAVALVVYGGLLFWGYTEPLSTQRGTRSLWSKFWRSAQAAPLPGKNPKAVIVQKPPPPPPPQALTRKEAEDLIGMSGAHDCSAQLAPQLRPTIRVSPLTVDALSELPKGASRMAAVPDVPASFQWPQMKGAPLDLIAQLRLSDVSTLDEGGLLPKTGWLCFFYALKAKPPATGWKPEDSSAWKVTYFDGDPNTFQRMPPPKPLKDEFQPCEVRFWKEWTLPPESDVHELLRENGCKSYMELSLALTCWPQGEAGWHHLLGYAQSGGGPMRAVCQLASTGEAVNPKTDPNDPKLQAADADAKDWVLLFQVQPGTLEPVDVDPNQPRWSGSGLPDVLYYWIRKPDLAARNFNKVWVLRRSFFAAYEADMAEEGGSLPVMTDEDGPE